MAPWTPTSQLLLKPTVLGREVHCRLDAAFPSCRCAMAASDAAAMTAALELNRKLKAMVHDGEPRTEAGHALRPVRLSGKAAVAAGGGSTRYLMAHPDPLPTRAPKNNFTFKDERLVEIGEGNLRLLKSLGQVRSPVLANQGCAVWR